MSLNLGIKPIFSKYHTMVSFLLTVSLIPLPAGNEISSDVAYNEKQKRIIHVKPEVLVCRSETSVSIVIFFSQLQNKKHAHLAGLIWAIHVFEYILIITKPRKTPRSSVTTLEEDVLFLEMPFNCTHFQDSSMTILGTLG